MTYSAGTTPFVPYGQGAPRGLTAVDIGTHGEEADRLVRLGLPTVPGITIPVQHAAELTDPDVARAAIALLGQVSLRRLEDEDRPVLMRVTSSAPLPASVLPPPIPALGVVDEHLERLLSVLGERGRLFRSWAETIRLTALDALDVPRDVLDDIAHEFTDPEEYVHALRRACATEGTQPYPNDPAEQLALAARATVARWSAPRSMRARRAQGLPEDLGLALHLEAIRIGAWDRSGRGTALSREPTTGEFRPTGQFFRGLGSHIPAGTVGDPLGDLPGGNDILLQALLTLESHYRSVVEVEFEIRDARLAIVSSQPVTRPTAKAAVRLAADLAAAGTINRALAVTSLHPDLVQELLHSQVVLTGNEQPFAFGLPASPGAATGQIALSSHEALDVIAAGGRPILVAVATTPADVTALLAAEAVITTTGGLASHAAVVARGAGRPAVCGVANMRIEEDRIVSGDHVLRRGDTVTVDGTTGTIYRGVVEVREAEPSADLAQLLEWADDHRRLAVRANADTPRDVESALLFGAEGIGLCRTEHQFLGDRLYLIRAFLLAEDETEVRAALDALFVAQREDFVALFEAVGSRPVTVRLLDAPLHEFIPEHGSYETSRHAMRAAELHESNPMLGLRGIRLALVHDELYPTQARALFHAWVDVQARGVQPALEIMLPLVSIPAEMAIGRTQVEGAWERVRHETGVAVPYAIGCMIETPRAALVADEFARQADFLSFGTNDLTQLTYGFSRDDIEKSVLQAYIDAGLMATSPFAGLDPSGVGQLVALAAKKARGARPDIKLGLCGEHGGDPASIDLIDALGLDYVSCSPPRVPVARLAAAHARLALSQGE